jgi:hypothetical protein
MNYIKPLALTTIAAALAACGGDDSNDDQAYLRVLHASADAPNVDVALNGDVVLRDVSFQQGTGYLEINDGLTTVEIRVAGTETVAFSTEVDLMDDGYYSVIAINDVAELDLKVIDDTSTYTDGDADVTVVHAATVADDVDIFVTAPGDDPDASADTPTLDGVPFEANATLEAVAAGDYEVFIGGDESEELVYASGELSVSADIALVAVNSTKGRSPVSLIAWSDSGATTVLDNSAELRVVHAVDDIDVDVFANGELFIDGFVYKTVNGYTVLEPGTVSVAISADAEGTQGLGATLANLSGDLTLERGESYIVIASGDSNAVTEAELIVLTDVREATDMTQGYVRLVHGSSSTAADPVDIFVYENGTTQPASPTFPDVEQGQDTGYVALAPATYTVDIAADGTTSPAISGTDALGFAAGDVKTAIAIGDSSGLEALLLDDMRGSGME